MCYSLYGYIQVMGNDEEQLNEAWLWEFISRTESFHCHFYTGHSLLSSDFVQFA